MAKQKIMYSSDDAAQYVTVKGWRSASGRFYGDDEHLARWDGCTHLTCECGAEVERRYTVCQKCRQKAREAKYGAMPFKEWDESTMLTLHDDDKYFRDKDEVLEYCHENNLNPKDLMLVICEPQYAWEINEDYYSDILPEDMTLDDCYGDLAKAIGKVNELIRKRLQPISWGSGKYRTTLSLSIPTKQEQQHD